LSLTVHALVWSSRLKFRILLKLAIAREMIRFRVQQVLSGEYRPGRDDRMARNILVPDILAGPPRPAQGPWLWEDTFCPSISCSIHPRRSIRSSSKNRRIWTQWRRLRAARKERRLSKWVRKLRQWSRSARRTSRSRHRRWADSSMHCPCTHRELRFRHGNLCAQGTSTSPMNSSAYRGPSNLRGSLTQRTRHRDRS
jgi:hypothetical protein